MKKKLSLIIIFTALGSILNAQAFSVPEQKVIDAVNNYWSLSNTDKGAWKNTFHDSYKGWNRNNETLSNKSMTSKWIDYSWGKDEVLFWNINPIGVQIYDDIAIVHYYYTTIEKNKETEKSSTSKGRWTDILMNVKGNWKLISDHGGKKESKTDD